MNGFMIKVLLT